VEKFEKAKKNKHMTFPEAAQLASEAKAKELWLTHFSPSLTWPESYVKQVKGIFDNVIAAKDGQTKSEIFCLSRWTFFLCCYRI
jgi:ribonuclease Z